MSRLSQASPSGIALLPLQPRLVEHPWPLAKPWWPSPCSCRASWSPPRAHLAAGPLWPRRRRRNGNLRRRARDWILVDLSLSSSDTFCSSAAFRFRRTGMPTSVGAWHRSNMPPARTRLLPQVASRLIRWAQAGRTGARARSQVEAPA